MKETVKLLNEISNKLSKMRNGSVYEFGSTKEGLCHSINDIAEKIFAVKVDLDLNDEDTIKLWDKCIEKATLIFFNYSLVEDNYDEFFRKQKNNVMLGTSHVSNKED